MKIKAIVTDYEKFPNTVLPPRPLWLVVMSDGGFYLTKDYDLVKGQNLRKKDLTCFNLAIKHGLVNVAEIIK